MATEGALAYLVTGETLFVGGDFSIPFTVYQSDGSTAQNITGWTVVLDIRRRDTSNTPPLLTVTATPTTPISGVCTFALSAEDLDADVFTGDEFQGRYSIWRTDTGSRVPLRYGDCVINRTTQADS